MAIGVVKSLNGYVTARSADGEIRVLSAGDSVDLNDVIITAAGSDAVIALDNGNEIQVQGGQELALDESVMEPVELTEAELEVLALQEALESGENIDELDEETAAGEEAGAGANNIEQFLPGDQTAGNVGTYLLDADDEDGVIEPRDLGDDANNVPEAQPELVELAEDTTVTGFLDATDADADADLTFSIPEDTTVPEGFVLVDPATGEYTFDASSYDYLSEGDVETFTFDYVVTDQFGASDRETVTVNITGTNDNPVAEVASAAAIEDGAVITGQLEASDVDQNDTYSFSLSDPESAPQGFTLNPDGSYSFDPTEGYDELAEGEDRVYEIEFVVTDDKGGTDTNILTLTITGTNDTPVAAAEVAEVVEDNFITGFLDASDVDNDAVLTFSIDEANAPEGLTLVDPATGEYSFDASSYDYLAVGETETVSVEFTVTDEHGATATNTIAITITGTNDVPVAEAYTDGAVTEVDGDTVLATSGTVDFSDADLSDGHVVSSEFSEASDTSSFGSADALGSLEVFIAQGDESTGDNEGTVTWNYTVNNSALEYLAEGEVRTETYTVTIDDGNGGTVTQDITVTITGTNDEPVIEGYTDGAVTEVDGSGLLTTSGTVDFSDVDLTDGHTVSVAPTGASDMASDESDSPYGSAAPYGVLTASISDAATGDGAGTVTWNYEVNNSALEYLAEGEERTETFLVTVTDSEGATATQEITVTITGTNDEPVIEGYTDGAVTEVDGSGLITTSGTVDFSDVDLADGHTVSVAPTGASDMASDESDSPYGSAVPYGTLTASVSDAATGDGAGTVTWNYEVNNSALEYLAEGEERTETFLVTVTDSEGATATQEITVTITGTNDEPVINYETSDFSGEVTEVTGSTLLSDTGTVDFGDVDLADGHSVTVLQATSAKEYDSSGNEISSNGAPAAYGTLTASVSDSSTGDGAGEITWNYEVDNAALEYLAEGETRTETFTIQLDDGNGGTVTKEISVTITGTNDVPEISGDNAGYVKEDTDVETITHSGVINIGPWEIPYSYDEEVLQDEGKLEISDLDHGQSFFQPADIEGEYGSFEMDSDGNWTYTINNATSALNGVQRLAEGEQYTEEFTVYSQDGTASHTVSVIVEGTNDKPAISSTTELAAVKEEIDLDGDGLLEFGGGFAFTDIDLADTHSVAYREVDANGNTIADDSNLGTFTTSVVDDTTGESIPAGLVSWNFEVDNDNPAVQALGLGEKIVQYYAVDLSDGTDVVTKYVQVTIWGTNGAPVIDSAESDISGGVTEDTSAVNGSLSTTGELYYSDEDTNDTHTASVVNGNGQSSGNIGSLSIQQVDDADDTVTWKYKVSNEDTQYLSEGETKTETFTVALSDGKGGIDYQTVTITLTGTNDTPVIENTSASDYIGAVTEDGAVLTDSGSIFFSDVDVDDAHEVSFKAYDSDGNEVSDVFTQGFSVQEISDTANGQGGEVQWTYTLDNDDPAVQALKEGETLTYTFKVAITDDSGVDAADGGSEVNVVYQDVTVTITGTNDVPVVTGDDSATLKEDTNVGFLGVLHASGDLDIVDADSGESAFQEAKLGLFNDSSIKGDYGILTIDEDGSWDYYTENYLPVIQQLGVGETITDDIVVKSVDGTEFTISITIQGTNDAPYISNVFSDFTGSVTEDAAAVLTDTGTIYFDDVDVRDGHTVEAVPVDSQGNPLPQGESYLGSLAAAVTEGAQGALNAGEIDWTYTVDDSAVQHLADGETVTEYFAVTVSDGTDTATKIVSVTVTGTNDAPEVLENVVRNLTEEGVNWDENSQGFQEDVSGNIFGGGKVTDVDTDLSDLSVTMVDGQEVPEGSTRSDNTPDGLQIEGTYGTLTVYSDGKYTYELDNDREATQALQEGQQVQETFEYTVSDVLGTGADAALTDTGSIIINITGTNDAPIAVGNKYFVEEDVTVTATGNVLHNDTDVDNIDMRDGDYNGTNNELSVTGVSSQNDSGSAASEDNGTFTIEGEFGTLVINSDGTFDYVLDHDKTDSLADGEEANERFTYTITDGAASDSSTLRFVITGTNDAPVINTETSNLEGGVTEDATSPSLTDSGYIYYSDVDSADDGHYVSAVDGNDAADGNLGTLSASVVNGVIEWDYSVDNSDVQYLAAGETRTETFTVTVADGKGGTDTETIEVTITGTNDAPQITSEAGAGSVTEDGALDSNGNVTTTGVLEFTDVDTIDTHSVSVQSQNGNLGTLGAYIDGNGDIKWTYRVDNDLLQNLNEDSDVSETFTVTVKDNNGATSSQTVTIDLNGINDAPVIGQEEVSTDIYYEQETASWSNMFGYVLLDENGDIIPDSGKLLIANTNQPGYSEGELITTVDGYPADQVMTFLVATKDTADQSDTYNIGSDEPSVTIEMVDGKPVMSINGVEVGGDNNDSVWFGQQQYNADGNDHTVETGGDSAYVVGFEDQSMGDRDFTDFQVKLVTNYSDTGEVDFTEDGPAVNIVDATFEITDVDDVNMEDAVIDLTDPETGDVLVLDSAVLVGTGISIDPASTDTKIILTGSASKETYEDVIKQIQFDSSNQDPDADRFIDITVNDGAADSNTFTVKVNVTAVNDAPETSDATVGVEADGTASFMLDVFSDPADSDVGGAKDIEDDADGTPLTLTMVDAPDHGTVYYMDGGVRVDIGAGDDFPEDAQLQYELNADYNGTVLMGTKGTTGTMSQWGDLNSDGDLVFEAGNGNTVTISASSDSKPDGTDTLGFNDSINSEKGLGLGVKGGDNGQIDLNDGESITVDFAQPVDNVTVGLSGLAQNFGTNYDATAHWVATLADGTTVEGDIQEDFADADGDGSTLTNAFTVNAENIVSIDFYVANETQNSNFTIQYIEFTNDLSDSFTYNATDSDTGVSNTSTVTFDIAKGGDLDYNAAPDAIDNTFSVAEDGSITITAAMLLGNDRDMDGDDLEIVGINSNGVRNGEFTDNGDGTYTFTPNENYNGNAGSFTYTISDGEKTDTATVKLKVTPVNDAPTAADDEVSLDEDTSIIGAALPEATDIEGDTVTYSLDTEASNGSVTVHEDGTFDYTPNENYNGPDSFSYTVDDGNGGTNTYEVKITVEPVNDAPDAIDDGSGLTFFGLTGNYYAVDTEDNSPNVAPDSDGYLIDNLTEFRDIVDSTDPVASFDANNIWYGYGTGSVSQGNNLENFLNEDGDSLTYSGGSVVNSEEGGFHIAGQVYMEAGTYNFRVTGDDGYGIYIDGEAVAERVNNQSPTTTEFDTFTISESGFYQVDMYWWDQGGEYIFQPEIRAEGGEYMPISSTPSFATAEDSPIEFDPATLLANDVDIDGDSLEVTGVSNPQNGTVTFENGVITFTPDGDYNGPASFQYSISDGKGGTDTATVYLNVTPVNDAPVIDNDLTDDTRWVTEDHTADNGKLYNGGILTFEDVDLNDAHRIEAVADSADNLGVIKLNLTEPDTIDGGWDTSIEVDGDVEAVRWSYSVENDDVQFLSEGQRIQETFTIKVYDEAGLYDEVQVTINLVGTNDTPEISSAVDSDLAGLATEDGDVDDVLSGSIYFEDADVNDAHTVDVDSYTVVDGEGNPVANAPAVFADGFEVSLGSDGQVDWTYTLDNSNPAVQALAEGETLTYTFKVAITDDSGVTAADADSEVDTMYQDVTVTIVGTNDAPQVTATEAELLEAAFGEVTEDVDVDDTTGLISQSGEIALSDVDGDSLSASAAADGQDYFGNLEVEVVNGKLEWTFTVDNEDPAFQALNSDDSFEQTYTVTISDGKGGTTTQEISVTVNGADDNSAPETDDTEYTIKEGVAFDGTIPATDSDGDSLEFTLKEGPTAGTLQLNSDGTYTYTPDAADNETSATQDSFTYTVSDGKGGTTEGTVTFNITDDAPTAQDDYVSHDEGQVVTNTVNLVLVLDSSGSMGGNRMAVAKDALDSLIDKYGEALGKVMLVDFDAGASLVYGPGGIKWMSGSEAQAEIDDHFYASGGTNYDSALDAVMNNYSAPGEGDTYMYFLSDGQPTSGGGISDTEQNEWFTFLKGTDIDEVFAVGIEVGSNQSAQDNLSQIAWSSADPDVEAGDNLILVNNVSDLAAELNSTVVAQTVEGNIVTENDIFGADGSGELVSIEIGGTTYSFSSEDSHEINLGDAGSIVIYSDGKYEFTPGTDIAEDITTEINYVIADSDGTESSATLYLTTTDRSEVFASDNYNEASVATQQLQDIDSFVFSQDISMHEGNYYGTDEAVTNSVEISDNVSYITFEIDSTAFNSGDSVSWQLQQLVNGIYIDLPGEGDVITNGSGDVLVQTGALLPGQYRVSLSATDGAGSGFEDLGVRVKNFKLNTPVDYTEVIAAAIAGNLLTDANDYIGTNDEYGSVDDTGSEGAALYIYDPAAGDYVEVDAGGVTITGDHGILTVDSTGAYSYDPNDSLDVIGQQEAFQYKLVQPDGDSDTADLVIDIKAVNDISAVDAILGTDEGTTIFGTEGADAIDGTDGNDYIDGLGGGDTINAGAGDDQIVFYEGDQIDGGEGTDTLLILGDGKTIDFENVQNIEAVDMSGNDSAANNLTLENVLNVTENNDGLFIQGDAGDSVTIEGVSVANSDASSVTITNGTEDATVHFGGGFDIDTSIDGQITITFTDDGNPIG